MPDRQTVELVVACVGMGLITTALAALTGWRSGWREATDGAPEPAPSPGPGLAGGGARAALLAARPARPARLALAVLAGGAAVCLGSWWLLASSDAEALRAALPLRPLAEFAGRLAPVHPPGRAGAHAADKAGLLLLHPWPMDRAAVNASEAERIAVHAAGSGHGRPEGAVLASVRSRHQGDYDCLCWVVFVGPSGASRTAYVVLVDARDGAAARPKAARHSGVRAPRLV